MRVILEPGFDCRESIAAFRACRSLGVPFVVGSAKFAEPGDVPIGTVDYCEQILMDMGLPRPVPEFYPWWLSGWMRRHWAVCNVSRDGWFNRANCPCFVKCADKYKAYPARVISPGDLFPDGEFIRSEVVTFTQEWRYYVSRGEVVTAGWYDGNDEDEPAPVLPIDWPKDFCGAVDFGRLDTGEIALVESHHPYACGWYGDDTELFVLWQIDGWQQMLSSLPQSAHVSGQLD